MEMIYSDENVQVYTDDYFYKGYRYPQGKFIVRSKHFRGKTFKGEMAWADSQRYANDHLTKLCLPNIYF